MFKTVMGVFVKVAVALAVVLGVVALLYRLEDSRSDYVEIYNDEDEGDY